MKIRIVLIDDDYILRENMEKRIKALIQEELILKIYSSAENFLEDCTGNSAEVLRDRFDLYILDVEMPGMSGMELARKIRKTDEEGEIIFLTSHEKYAIDGYGVRACEYILKEQMEVRLPDALKRLERVLRLRNQRYYLIETGSRLQKLLYEDIVYIYKEEKNCIFVTKQGEERQRIALGEVCQRLDAPEFIYVDKGKIVNVRNVNKLVKDTLYLTGDAKLAISRSNLKSVKLAVRTYWNHQL